MTQTSFKTHPSQGARSLSGTARPSARALCLLLGLPKTKEKELAQKLCAVGGLSGLKREGPQALVDGVGHASVERVHALFAVFEYWTQPVLPERSIECAEDVWHFLGQALGDRPEECIWMLALDCRGRALALDLVAQGCLGMCLLHPRELFARALRCRAASLIVVHNHPSGDPSPSVEDEELTLRLGRAGDLLGIPVLDHIIVARGGYTSLMSSVRCGASESEN